MSINLVPILVQFALVLVVTHRAPLAIDYHLLRVRVIGGPLFAPVEPLNVAGIEAGAHDQADAAVLVRVGARYQGARGVVYHGNHVDVGLDKTS